MMIYGSKFINKVTLTKTSLQFKDSLQVNFISSEPLLSTLMVNLNHQTLSKFMLVACPDTSNNLSMFGQLNQVFKLNGKPHMTLADVLLLITRLKEVIQMEHLGQK